MSLPLHSGAVLLNGACRSRQCPQMQSTAISSDKLLTTQEELQHCGARSPTRWHLQGTPSLLCWHCPVWSPALELIYPHTLIWSAFVRLRAATAPAVVPISLPCFVVSHTPTLTHARASAQTHKQGYAHISTRIHVYVHENICTRGHRSLSIHTRA